MKPKGPLAGYLQQIAGVRPVLHAIGAARLKGLPAFLTLNYRFHEWTWLEQKLVLAEAKSTENDPVPAQVMEHRKLLTGQFSHTVVFVFPTLDPYRRDRFTQLGLPFIVPGRQFFIPPFARLLERYHQVDRPEKLSAPAQVVVLYQLLQKPPEASLMTQWAGWIGYSAMTLSKVRDELVALGLCADGPGEKPRGLHFLRVGRMLWDAARPRLTSPVQRVYGAMVSTPQPALLQAGITALSRQTMLGDEQVPTYACRNAEWRRLVHDHTIKPAAHPDEASARIEAWRYDPRILGRDGTVDRLSLYLSLAQDPDERVRLAANTLLEGVSW